MDMLTAFQSPATLTGCRASFPGSHALPYQKEQHPLRET